MTKRPASFGDININLIGKGLKEGFKAPDFKILDIGMKDINFYDGFKGKNKIISIIPSLDVSLCEIQTSVFDKKYEDLSSDTVILSISLDLPFALSKFKESKKIKNIIFLSDYRYREFGKKYQVLMEELKLLNRSVFVIDANNILRHVEYVLKNTDLPDIEKAIDVANSL